MRPFLQTTKTISTASPLKRSAPILLQAASYRCYRHQQEKAPFSTHGAPMQTSSPGNLLKSTAKAIDHAAATAALKGIEVGEKVATKTRETVGKTKKASASGSGSDASLPAVDMYGEQDESNLTGESDQATSVAEKAREQGVHTGKAAAQAKQKAGEKAGEAAEGMKHAVENMKRGVSNGTKKTKEKVVG